ncbi:hypothetical protein ABIA14_004460 [Sinorhizobium fredii]|uniref:T4SS efffector SepA family protein n=1 Tax=Rhizobium fredii TaxID=380 RepID=UPI0035181C51
MAPSVELTPQTFKRLQTHAVPLVDTIETVISRMIDSYESKGGASFGSAEGGDGQSVRMFNANTPPDLTHAKILGVTFNGQKLGRGQDNWNGLLNAAVREAKAKSKSPSEFKQLMVVNHVEGEKQDEGYRPLSGTGISVQGQDANGAWRAACHIAQQLGCDLSVKFAWREKDGAAYPGVTGQMTISSK